MKQILKIIIALLIFAALPTNSAFAGSKNENEVTLVVTSNGATKDEAIKNALRSAIEQTYGVFVSSNTDILNDDIVKDEIATVSTGNIKKYTELSHVNADGTNTVTVEVIVSIGKLISYAKSKGAECEFDGEALYADLEMQALYQKNEEKAIRNILNEISHMFKDGFDYSLKISRVSHKGQPIIGGYWPHTQSPVEGQFKNNVDPEFYADIEIKLNQQGEDAWAKLINSLKTLGLYKGVDRIYHPRIKVTNFAAAISGRGGFEILEGNDEFLCHIAIPEAKICYTRDDPSELYAAHFFLRSQHSAKMIEDFIRAFPEIVNNFSILTNTGDIISFIDLRFKKTDNAVEGPGFDDEDKVNYFNKKKGKTLAQLRGVFSLPANQIKQVSKLSIKYIDNLNL